MAQEEDQRTVSELVEAASKTVLRKIADGKGGAGQMKDWAEAYAWLTVPHQSHGGATTVSVGK